MDDRSKDAAWFMDAVVIFAGGFLVLIVFVAVIHLLFSLEPDLPEKLDGGKLPALTTPIPYDATVTQPGPDGAPRTRYYTRSAK